MHHPVNSWFTATVIYLELMSSVSSAEMAPCNYKKATQQTEDFEEWSASSAVHPKPMLICLIRLPKKKNRSLHLNEILLYKNESLCKQCNFYEYGLTLKYFTYVCILSILNVFVYSVSWTRGKNGNENNVWLNNTATISQRDYLTWFLDAGTRVHLSAINMSQLLGVNIDPLLQRMGL